MSVLRADPDNGSIFLDWPTAKVSAMECGLYLCVKQFTSNVANGIVYETSKAVDWARNPQSWQLASGQNVSMVHNTTALYDARLYYPRDDLQLLIATPTNLSTPIPSVNISCGGGFSLIQYLTKTFNDGTLDKYSGEGKGPMSAIGYGITGMTIMDAEGTVKYSPGNMQALWNASNLPKLFDSLASSISNNSRMNADVLTQTSGRTDSLESLIVVRWCWVALPCVCTLLGIFFLGAAIWETHRNGLPLWKSSILATLFHGFDPELRVDSDNHPLLSDMVADANRMVVQLQSMGQGRYALGGTSLLHERRLNSLGEDDLQLED